MSCVGKSVKRLDALAKVRGSAKYASDFFVRDMLVAKVLHSTIANGWVKRIDVSKAKALPGVEAVVTYEDVPKHCFPTAGHPWSTEPAHQDVQDRNILTRRIRYYGDEIAAVVAVDEITAEKALNLIEVEYEEYEPILTAEAALKEGAVEIHEGSKNIIKNTSYVIGDFDEVNKEADYFIEGYYKTPVVQHCHIEPINSYAYVDDHDRIVVVSSTQIPHICRRVVGQALGIPWGKVRVIKPYIGGGFGNKQDVIQEPLNAFLALQVNGRPVKLEYSREEIFVSSRTRHAFEFKVKSGVKKDGTLVSVDIDAISLNGAYASHGHSIAGSASSKFRYLYNHKAIKSKSTTVYTNMPTAGAMRGYGIPQITFALEAHMDDIAKELNLDPVAFREDNLLGVGYVDPLTKIRVLSNGMAECIAKGKELIRWEEKRELYKNQNGTKRRGIGMAIFSYLCGTWPVGIEIAGCRIIMNQDGSVQLEVGATEIGQGSDTVWAQIAADAIGIPVDMVHVKNDTDTDSAPFDTGSYASRQSYITGMAVKKAADEIKEKVLDYAWGMTDIPKNSLDIVDANLVYKHDGTVIMPLADIALDTFYNRSFARPIVADVSNNARINAPSFGCTFVELEIDMLAGKVDILELYNVHDCGKVINPLMAEGQVHGGVSMSIGYGLSEQMLIDPKTGKVLNNNLLDYKLATTMDTPEIGSAFVETFEPTSSNGHKSLGEPTTLTPAPAIRNAILHATGVKFEEIPLTPQRLFEKFKAQGLI